MFAKLSRALLLAAASMLVLVACFGGKSGKTLRLATTTSVQDSGLLAELVPAFEKRSGHKVEVRAVGSGKALELLRAGEADVAITHAPDDEQRAISAGHAARRTPFMRSDFVIVGPKDTAATVAGASDFRDVLRKIAASGRKFISRGDGSGTHLREQALWKAAGIAPSSSLLVEAKAGMAETLKRASEEDAFALTDRATFIAHRGDFDLAIVFQGDDELRNVYSVMEPPGAEQAGARALTEFVRSAEGRATLGAFGVKAFGEPLFSLED
jgi:tungstate transport system substrate-binding protein